MKASLVNSTNRNHFSAEGQPAGKHTSGSRSFHDTRIMLEKKLMRLVASVEVYMYTHTKKKDKRPVDDVAAQVEELFQEKVPDILPYLGQKDERILDELLHEADMQFVECTGGVKNGRITGLGNLSLEYSDDSTVRSLPSEVLTQQVSQLSEENSRLREDLSAVHSRMDEERQRFDEERQRSAAAQEAMQAELARTVRLVAHFVPTNCDPRGP